MTIEMAFDDIGLSGGGLADAAIALVAFLSLLLRPAVVVVVVLLEALGTIRETILLDQRGLAVAMFQRTLVAC
jgi:hypothetical protein